jgi:hypothetical protein
MFVLEIFKKIIDLYPLKRVISSAGSEHYLDKVGVTGSNPVSPTKRHQK